MNCYKKVQWIWLTVLMLVLLGATKSWSQEQSSSDEGFRNDKKWGQSYFGLASATAKQVQEGAPSISIYNYVGANYKLSQDERINIRPAFSIYTSGFDQYGIQQNTEVKLGDLYINYANYKLALLPGEWGLSGQFRLYLPTSKSTQDKKTICYLNAWIVTEKGLTNGWGTSYNMKPTYYFQSQKAYRNEYERLNTDGTLSSIIETGANPIGKLDHYMTLSKYLNETFTPKIDLGFLHGWNYTSDYVSKGSASRNQLKIAPGTEIHVNRSLWFLVGIENDIDLNDTRFSGGSTLNSKWEDSRGQTIYLFRPENTQYQLFTFWTL